MVMAMFESGDLVQTRCVLATYSSNDLTSDKQATIPLGGLGVVISNTERDDMLLVLIENNLMVVNPGYISRVLRTGCGTIHGV